MQLSYVLFLSGTEWIMYHLIRVPPILLCFEMLYDILNDPIRVSTRFDESVIVTHVYRACPVLFMGYHTLADLFTLDIDDFDIVLGMTLFSAHYVVLNCNTKSVTLEIPGRVKLQ